MLGLSGYGWMLVSMTLGFVVHEIIKALSTATDEDAALSYNKVASILFDIAGIGMFIFAVIGIFFGHKWYGTILIFFCSFLITGPILHRVTALIIRNGETLFNICLPIMSILQLISAILAYIAWF